MSEWWNVIKWENQYIIVDLNKLKKLKRKNRDTKPIYENDQYWKCHKEMKRLNGEEQ